MSCNLNVNELVNEELTETGQWRVLHIPSEWLKHVKDVIKCDTLHVKMRDFHCQDCGHCKKFSVCQNACSDEIIWLDDLDLVG